MEINDNERGTMQHRHKLYILLLVMTMLTGIATIAKCQDPMEWCTHEHDGIPSHSHRKAPYYTMVFSHGVKTQTPPRWHHHEGGGCGDEDDDTDAGNTGNTDPAPPSNNNNNAPPPGGTPNDPPPEPPPTGTTPGGGGGGGGGGIPGGPSNGGTTPTGTNGGGGGGTSGGTPEGTGGSATPLTTVTPQLEPTPTPEPIADPKRVLATEWILVDNGRSVPQWIEIWNNNPVEIDLTGWKFHHVSFENFKTKEKIVTLTEFSIPAGEAVILASHATQKKTVAPEQVYNLDIGYVLKKGWKLTTADGIVVHAIGEIFTGIERTRPQYGRIEGSWRAPSRISHKNYPSDAPETPHYYGHAGDQAHPAHHAPCASSTVSFKTQANNSMGGPKEAVRVPGAKASVTCADASKR